MHLPDLILEHIFKFLTYRVGILFRTSYHYLFLLLFLSYQLQFALKVENISGELDSGNLLVDSFVSILSSLDL